MRNAKILQYLFTVDELKNLEEGLRDIIESYLGNFSAKDDTVYDPVGRTPYIVKKMGSEIEMESEFDFGNIRYVKINPIKNYFEIQLVVENDLYKIVFEKAEKKKPIYEEKVEKNRVASISILKDYVGLLGSLRTKANKPIEFENGSPLYIKGCKQELMIDRKITFRVYGFEDEEGSLNQHNTFYKEDIPSYVEPEFVDVNMHMKDIYTVLGFLIEEEYNNSLAKKKIR